MQTVKEKITEVVMAQPDDATYDEIMRELSFCKRLSREMVMAASIFTR